MAKSTVRPAITRTLTRNASNLMKALIDRNAVDLITLPDLDELGDQALNAFAHDISIGIAGLCMEGAGYVWRAHAKEVLPFSRRPDYLWIHPLAATGVVVSEVKGMAGSTQSLPLLKARVHKAFDEQVDPWKLALTPSGRPIVGGYAIGVRATHSQGAEVAAVRSFPLPSTTGASPGLPSAAPDPTIVRRHFASALALMGLGGMSRQVARLPRTPSPELALELLQVDDMRFVVRSDWRRGAVIAMAEEAFDFAIRLAGTGRVDGYAPSETSTPPVFRARAEEEEEGDRGWERLLVLAPDGLGLIKGSRRAIRRMYGVWTPAGINLSG